MTTVGGIGIIVALFLIASLYFILTFIESLHLKDQRVIKQSKFSAIFCFAIAVLLPTLYHLFT